MTIGKVIDRVRSLKKGYDISDEQIIYNINNVEMNIINTIISGREDDSRIEENYGGYNIESDRSKQLLLNPPFDTLYETFCCAQIELEYEDIDRYTNLMLTYNQLLQEFTAYWYRTHRQNKRHIFHM